MTLKEQVRSSYLTGFGIFAAVGVLVFTTTSDLLTRVIFVLVGGVAIAYGVYSLYKAFDEIDEIFEN
jgi:hypothetical protein